MASTFLTQTSNTIKINELFPIAISQTSYTAQYTLKNIVNPNKTYTQILTFYLYASDGSLQNMADVNLVVESAQFTCTGVPSTLLISSFSEYAFTVTPTVALPSTGYVMANFPSQWSDSA